MKIERFIRDNLEAELGQRFVSGNNEYELGGKIGDGAIGVVRKATNIKSGNLVAVKFLAPELKYIEENSLEDIYFRFKREGTRGVSLGHNNLVEIVSYEDNINGENFTSDNSLSNPFIIMEYVKGRTLESHINKYAKPEPAFNISPQTLTIAYSITDALVHLHDRAIVHRDVKPANIFMSKAEQSKNSSQCKLGDFGVVKWGDYKASLTSGSLTLSGHQGLGTFKYMSPEQSLEPKAVNVRSDMYSLGITLFELFTGQIFPTPYHVFQLSMQRYERKGNTMSYLFDLGLGMIPLKYEILFSKLYDMFLKYPKSRPSSIEMRGILNFLLN